MPSPFAGMDPFLEEERLWPWFQHQLAITLQSILSANVILDARHDVKIGARRFFAAQQEHCSEYVAVHAKADGRLVSLLDIVSPADKLTEVGRAAFLATRRSARESGASVTEIDLVLRGRALLEYSREGLPHWDYAVTVTRSTTPVRYELYVSTLEKRLPRFRLPTSADDWDAVVDLPKAFRQTYDDCGFADQIDYGKDPPVPLSAEVLARVSELLREQRAS